MTTVTSWSTQRVGVAVVVLAFVVIVSETMWMGVIITGLRCCDTEVATDKNNGMPWETVPEHAGAAELQRRMESSPIIEMDSTAISDEDYQGPQRVFEPWEHPFPCNPAHEEWWTSEVQRAPASTGFLFVRNMKTGSSTLAGVALRIARAKARQVNLELCETRFDHTDAFTLQYGSRNKTRSYLWSFVRDPTDRVVSEFFHFGVSRAKVEPTDANFKRHILTPHFLHNYFLWDMSVNSFDGVRDKDRYPEAVESILNEYNFIGVMERMDESLVVMKMLLDLDMNDILYLSAKRSSGYDDGAWRGACNYIIPSFVSPGMRQFFASEEWQKRIRGDQLLLKAVNRSLDLTIDRLGRGEVKRQVAEFRRLQQLANDSCFANTIFPCTEDGEFHHHRETTCLWRDSGCGYKCLDDLAATNR